MIPDNGIASTHLEVRVCSNGVVAVEQGLGEQYYLNLALQMLEMAASEYQWSSDVLVSKLDELRNIMKKSNAGEISRRQVILFGTSAILALSNPSALVPEEILPFIDKNIATCWQMSNGKRTGVV